MKRTLLIDGDIIVYRYASTVEHEVDWGDDVWSLWSDAKEAKQLILQYLEHLVEMTAADDFIFCFSDKDNFRKAILPTYKSNRKGKRKPICYKGVKAWIESMYQHKTISNLEGDDVMGILATNGSIEGETVIVSEDKDMKTIPCLLWRNAELERISEEQADYFHLYQTLVGDTTDGYGGLRGVGDKRATTLLEEPTWETVVGAYEKAGYTEEDALVQARVARILRASDFNADKQEPILWTP
jgi:DNA polymerase-1